MLDLIDDTLEIHRDHLSISLIPEFIPPAEANSLLDHLIDTVSWQQPRIRVYGKRHLTPRLVSYYADENLSYRYTDLLHGSQPWTDELAQLKTRLSQSAGMRFNAVLLNYYRDGQDSMGWHADDEKELGINATIASLSLGAARDIYFKPKSTKGDTIKINLPSGSLLIMSGNTQQHWLHHIPKRLSCTAPRINLTFRKIIPI